MCATSPNALHVPSQLLSCTSKAKQNQMCNRRQALQADARAAPAPIGRQATARRPSRDRHIDRLRLMRELEQNGRPTRAAQPEEHSLRLNTGAGGARRPPVSPLRELAKARRWGTRPDRKVGSTPAGRRRRARSRGGPLLQGPDGAKHEAQHEAHRNEPPHYVRPSGFV